jgi:cyclic beta-1,2-glucan synthetase
MAPIIAWFLSVDIKQDRKRLDADKDLELYKIARKTWGYFETFVNLESHYLAVDNFQEEPYRGVAHRTSPTNIGFGLLAIITAKDLGFIGYSSMLRQITNTTNTIKKLEKWHGHLYNWYNTKNLEPLRPYYISTVDSGNFVCYLITLRESLKEYQKRMLVEPTHFSGINATYDCDEIGRNPLFLQSEIENNSIGNQIISVSEYFKSNKAILLKLRNTCDTSYQWMVKVEQIIVESMKEVELFFPWISILDEITFDLMDTEIQIEGKKLRILLDSPISLNNYEDHCKKILQTIKHIVELLSVCRESVGLLTLEWLHVVEEKVQQGFDAKRVYANNYQDVLNEIDQVISGTSFKQLYEPKRHLFSIGYSFEYGRLSNSYYDLLASEARQTSYLAIANGEIEAKHWNRLGRNMAKVGANKGLKSWSGTMFEYFMPFIIMKNYKETLWDATYAFVIKTQMKYGKERNIPWGLSESGFASINLQLDYQYKAIGIPWLGLKRGLMEDIVAAPYATFLTLPFFPSEAYCNIMKLKKEGMLGKYGYYEAIDFTTERLGPNEKSIIVKSYMAHHEGMSLLSINNYLNNKIFQTRFFADPSINAAKLLLQEKIPQNHIVVKQKNEKVLPIKSVVTHDSATYRRYTEPDLTLPNVHILSNGFYTVLATDRGTGYSSTKEYWISRWRPDMFHQEGGMYFYIKNKSNEEVWSAAYAPINKTPKDYEVVFKADRMILSRTNGLISTQTEIIVASGDNAEIRRIEIKNNDNKEIEFEITSYFEIVMDDRKGDEAHQAFRKLFIETEYCREYNALIAHRRKRDSGDKDLWIGQMAIVNHGLRGEISYESDRKKFIGRGHTLKNPIVMEENGVLSNSVGGVLDPIFSLRIPVCISSEASTRISFVTMTGNNREEIMELFAKYNAIENCDAAFWLAVIRSQVENKYLNLKAREMELYQAMISDLLFLSPRRRKNEAMMKKNKRNQMTLWGNGISGDNPIVLLTLNKLVEVVVLYDLLKAQEYWRLKDLRVDLIIIVLEEYSYENPIFSMVKEIIEQNIVTSVEQKRGIFSY